MATAREHSLVAVLRRQLVSHRGIELGGPHVGHHLLAGRRMGVRWMGIVRLHRVRRWRQRRAHVLLWLLRLGLGRRLLLTILQAYWRQIERRQRHVCALGRAAIGLVALWPLGRRVRVRGLHRGRRVRVRRGIGTGLLSLLLLLLAVGVGHAGLRQVGRGGRVWLRIGLGRQIV
jgi:hypothetical protein